MLCDKNLEIVMDVFHYFVPGFGARHAKLFLALCLGEAKTATQLIKDSGISDKQIYQDLNFLASEDLIKRINSRPAAYVVLPSSQGLTKKFKLKQKELQEKYNTAVYLMSELKQLKINEEFTVVLANNNTLIKIIPSNNPEKPILIEEAGEISKVKQKIREWKQLR